MRVSTRATSFAWSAARWSQAPAVGCAAVRRGLHERTASRSAAWRARPRARGGVEAAGSSSSQAALRPAQARTSLSKSQADNLAERSAVTIRAITGR
ncbi:hypothetical protein [Streptomyces sp. HO565]|uniref:hypothetical protein n=1 Tax=Streptomyces sp. HO565 TaxID=2857489 RepID=UPI0038B543A1